MVIVDGMATPPPSEPAQSKASGGFGNKLVQNNLNNGKNPGNNPSASEPQDEKKVEPVIVESTSLDLETYIANYTGHTRVTRLEFIGDYCPPLRIDAYQIALKDLLNTFDTDTYFRIAKKLNDALTAQGKNLFVVDTDWVAKTHKTASNKQERLEAELKNYKSNYIKESIRMGNNDLGDYYYQRGDLNNALKCYTRTRDYCTSPKHVIQMCTNVIKVSIELGNYSYVLNYTSKAENVPDMKDSNVLAKLKVANALSHLENAKYKQAAKTFIETPFEIDTSYNEVISPQDIATYGGLCALASFDRAEIKSKILDNPAFKQFLELTPVVRQIIEDFYHSRYGTCLKNLQNLQCELLLDIHLFDHAKALYESIRKKALVQYFSPFFSVDMNKMATTFNMALQALETELAGLIMDNQIQARIDSHNKILYARQTDQRATTFEKAVETGGQYQRSSKALLLRLNMLKSDFVVRAPRPQN